MFAPKIEPSGGRVEFDFTVRLVRTTQHLRRAVKVRAAAYSRHVPALGERLLAPELSDTEPGSVLFLAESKADHSPQGTLRIQTNLDFPFTFESQIALPQFLQDNPIAFVARLAVLPGPNSTNLRNALFKALHRYCLATQIRWMVVAARRSLERRYRQLGFADVFPNQPPAILPSMSPNPVRFLYFDALAAERVWYSTHHPLYGFMFLDQHPDIQVFSSVSSAWTRPRKQRRTDNPSGIAAEAKRLQLRLPDLDH